MNIHNFLVEFWIGVVGLSLLLYVVLDGFDLGVGILTLVACDEDRRGMMMASLSSVWDANETWLVLLGGVLFGAFPPVYAALMQGLYIPVTIMLFALIMRGVAFEFRHASKRKILWNMTFGLGSLGAAISQGVILGALIQGWPTTSGNYINSGWHWFTPFSLLTALGVALGYALMGAGWLILKTSGQTQDRAYRRGLLLLVATLVAGALILTLTPAHNAHIAALWQGSTSLPYALAGGAAIFATLLTLWAYLKRREYWPFFGTLLLFTTSFVGLVGSLYPYAIGPTLTWTASASAPGTQLFMLAGILPLIPIMLFYNGYQYMVFRGKVSSAAYGDDEESGQPANAIIH
ncbi:MAG: cytochrome d ubiquinol oxidase subunit II [Sulfuriferula sp.]